MLTAQRRIDSRHGTGRPPHRVDLHNTDLQNAEPDWPTTEAQVATADVARRRPWSFRARGWAGGLAILAASLAVLASTAPFPRSGRWSDIAWDAAAWSMFLAGLTFRFWATLYVGGRKSHLVVCTGPYSICRHPLYVGTFLIWLSAAVFLHSVTFAVGIMAAIVFYIVGTIPAEESQLVACLGADYEAYMRRTPRFWPQWRDLHLGEKLLVDVPALSAEARRALRWIFLPLLADCLAQLQLQPWWPHGWWLP
ncbi:MAG: isoprenylcysteine carboxylmethyltransferase family protein [Planctomycetes bacterium]|nr:isoprenylcysteine carboxylmethyltransferase family protein [Planctomycetota bacterium]